MRLETYIITFAKNSQIPKFDSPKIMNLSEYHPDFRAQHAQADKEYIPCKAKSPI